MSPTDWSLPGIKGKRIPGRPGRFDPSEPLHMTTRRAAKTGPNNESPSLNGSAGDDESRRGSFDDLRPITSHSNGSHFSVKSRRPSEVSIQMNSPENGINGLTSSEEKRSSVSKPVLSPIQQTPSPSRKRKRSSSTTLPQSTEQFPFNNSFNYRDEIASPTKSPQSDDEGDTVEVIPFVQLSDREPSDQASGASSRSEDEQDQHGETFATQSMDVSPTAYPEESPNSSASRSPTDGLPLAKPLEEALNNIVQNAPEEEEEVAEAADEMEVDVDVDMDVDADGEGAEDADDADEQVQSDDDERPARRFGGRRRARHPIPKVEKAMQRQAQLKSAYRAIARAQKVVLAEIAQRTIENLQANPALHLESVEYRGVKEGLDDALEERKYQVYAQHKWNLEQLHNTLDSEQRNVKDKHQQGLPETTQYFLASIEREMLNVMREARRGGAEVDHVTDDEDDVVTKLRQVGNRAPRQGTDAAYMSRSRLIMEVERVTEDTEKRLKMADLLRTLDEDDKPDELKQRTIMGDGPRNTSNARRRGTQGTNTLAAAVQEVERIANIPIIRNEDASGLQALGNAAMRHQLPKKQPSQRPGRKGPSRALPPQLQIPPNYRQSPIPVEMSPRTELALGDRFENSMPPPATPRNRPSAFMRSPDAMRVERPLQSPTINPHRFNEPHTFSARTPDRRPESRREGMPEHHNGFPDPRPRSQHKPDTFSPPQLSEQRMDYPTFREYPREHPPVIQRRGSSARERPPFNFASHVPLRDERLSLPDQRAREASEARDAVRDNFTPYGPQHHRPPYWSDTSSRPGAADVRSQDPQSPTREIDQSQAPSRSRNSSFSVQDFRPTLELHKESRHRKQHRPSKSSGSGSSFSQSHTNKAEREGLSRKSWSERRFSRSVPKPVSAGTPTLAASSSLGSPVERVHPPPWHGPPQPQHSPLGVPPPPATYQQSPYSQPPPPPPSFPSAQQGRDYYHRNTFPQRPTSSSFDRLPPTPLYVVPQQHPPPPGVPPEQYNRPFAPPPPPGYQPPPPPPQTPQTPYPPPTSAGSYGQQFGGPPLAPAPGFRPAPAFAQQAQQQQNSFGPRRRTQSDASQFAKFQPWNPPSQRR